MDHQADARLSNALLLTTMAVYIAILAALFAGMMVAQPSAAEALCLWAKDYGSLIAGVPVFVALIIAKQQLDAGRAQHEAGIRLQFKDEIDGLQMAGEVASAFRRPMWMTSLLFDQKRRIRDSEMEAVAKSNSPDVVEAFNVLKAIVNDGQEYRQENKGLIERILGNHPALGDDRSRAADDVVKAIERRKVFLRQFLPGLQ